MDFGGLGRAPFGCGGVRRVESAAGGERWLEASFAGGGEALAVGTAGNWGWVCWGEGKARAGNGARGDSVGVASGGAGGCGARYGYGTGSGVGRGGWFSGDRGNGKQCGWQEEWKEADGGGTWASVGGCWKRI